MRVSLRLVAVTVLALVRPVAAEPRPAGLEATTETQSAKAANGDQTPEINLVPFIGPPRPKSLSVAEGASILAYDCTHVQSGTGLGVINPCTGNLISEVTRVDCIGTLSRRPDGVTIDAHDNTRVSSRMTDTGTGEKLRMTGSGVVVFSEANAMQGITIHFKGRARGRQSEIAIDWHGLVAIDSATGEVTQLGVPGPAFSDGWTCVDDRDHGEDDEQPDR